MSKAVNLNTDSFQPSRESRSKKNRRINSLKEWEKKSAELSF